MSEGDELWVYQEYVVGKGWGAIAGYVPQVGMTVVFQNRNLEVTRRLFAGLAREHTRKTGNRLRLAKFQLVSAEELT